MLNQMHRLLPGVGVFLANQIGGADGFLERLKPVELLPPARLDQQVTRSASCTSTSRPAQGTSMLKTWRSSSLSQPSAAAGGIQAREAVRRFTGEGWVLQM